MTATRIANVVLPDWTDEGQLPVVDLSAPGVGWEAFSTMWQLPGTPVSDAELETADLLYLEAGLRAAADGVDAIFVNSVLDYGVEALRAASGLPAVGAGEAAIALASCFGDTFSIVTVWPELTHSSYERLVQHHHAEAACVSIRHTNAVADMAALGGGSGVKTRLMRGSDDVLDRIVATCDAAVTEDHCDVIVLGCTCMTPVLGLLQARVSVPVIDPMRAGYKLSETAALSVRRPESDAAVTARSWAEVRATVAGFRELEAASGPSCPVCVA